MSWYRGTGITPSNESQLELDLFLLCLRGFEEGKLLARPLTQRIVVLTDNPATWTQSEGPPFCRPDLLFHAGPLALCVFVDGPVHLHKTISHRDRLINEAMEARGIPYLRLPYLLRSAEVRDAMYAQIVDFVNRYVSQMSPTDPQGVLEDTSGSP